MIIEIRAAEGGDDAKDLVLEQARIYTLLCSKRHVLCEILDLRPGLIILRVTGEGHVALFSCEAGGHRWQRVPPNERRGRVHTSTVTVAVLEEPTAVEVPLSESDLVWEMKRGSGPGGQHRNKTESAVVLKHTPSGLIVRCENERSQRRNRESALLVMRARLLALAQSRIDRERDSTRRGQLGSGMRGDKRRTIRVQDGSVIDHVTGQTWRYRDYVRGCW